MHSIIFEHQMESLNSREQTIVVNIIFLRHHFFKTCLNDLKNLAYIFQVVVHFPSGHLQPVTLANSFNAQT